MVAGALAQIICVTAAVTVWRHHGARPPRPTGRPLHRPAVPARVQPPPAGGRAAVGAHLDDDGATDGARLGTAVIDLLAAALSARSDDPAQTSPHDHQRALLLRIHTFIDQRLGDPELSPDTIAAAHHISRRYLYKLFERQQHSVAGWIRQRRLERARRDLLDPALRARPVNAIAARWGMPDATHFSRMFRAAYGVLPGEYRALGDGTATDPAPEGS